MIQGKRDFEVWSLGSSSLEAVSKQAQFAQSDFEDLAKSMNVSGVTVSNFLSMYDNAVKNSFDPQTINQWNSLGTALQNATNAQSAYINSLSSFTQNIYNMRVNLANAMGQDAYAITREGLIASAKIQIEGLFSGTKASDAYIQSQIDKLKSGNIDWYEAEKQGFKPFIDTLTTIISLDTQRANSIATTAVNNVSYMADNVSSAVAIIDTSFQDLMLSISDYISELTNEILGISTSTNLNYKQTYLSFLTGGTDINTLTGVADDYLSSYKNSSTSKLDYIREIASVRQDMINAGILINGSHASGLDYVPFDGYRAELHKGERVQTASEVQKDTVINDLKNEIKELKNIFLKNTAEMTRMSKAIIRVIPDGDAIAIRTAV